MNQPLQGNKSDTMPIKAFRSLLKVVSSHGYEVDKVLETIGLDYNPLLPAFQHITSVPTKAYSRLYRQLMILLQDEAFGMMMPDRSPPGTFRMMCLFIIHCRNLRQALVRSAEFFDYCDSFHHTGTSKRTPIQEIPEQGQARLRFYSPATATGDNLATEASVMYMMYRFFSWLTGQILPLHSVHFQGDNPSIQIQYERLFKVPVRCQQPENCLLLPIKALDLPVVQTEQSLNEFLKSAPYPLISSEATVDSSDMSERVRAIFNDHFGKDIPSAQAVAETLNMSARTLHRHLKKEGSSYQQLKDEFRKEAVLSYMNRSELSITTIAILMGFQDSSAFHRSFKKWTGMSPGEYRRQLAGDQEHQQA